MTTNTVHNGIVIYLALQTINMNKAGMERSKIVTIQNEIIIT
jgi:hypothetical protein